MKIERPNNPFVRLMIDILGFSLLFFAALTGWIPGPGGIPLLLAGLGVLSINHGWARRLLKKVKTEGLNLSEKIFIDHPVAKNIVDLIGLGLMFLAFYLLNEYTKIFIKSLAIMAFFTGISLFLGNRKRLRKITAWAKQRVKRK